MTTANIKTALIEKVNTLNKSDVKRVYGMMLEYDINSTLFNSWNEVPTEHKRELEKGINDLKNGRKQKANEFIKDIKKKYA